MLLIGIYKVRPRFDGNHCVQDVVGAEERLQDFTRTYAINVKMCKNKDTLSWETKSALRSNIYERIYLDITPRERIHFILFVHHLNIMSN